MTNYTDTIIIGGGASGLVCASKIKTGTVKILERLERVGKKLSATGNGQGNLTNENMDATHYFSSEKTTYSKVEYLLDKYGKNQCIADFNSLGGATVSDAKGRVYPSSRQASAITDLLRYYLSDKGVEIETGVFVKSIAKNNGLFTVKSENKDYFCKNVVICVGGKSAKNFGTDGNGYALSQSFGHIVTKTYPSLVQIKTDTTHIKSLKGIRVADAKLSLKINGEKITEVIGDVIFTDYGISGDAVFKISSYITGNNNANAELFIDLLPFMSEESLKNTLIQKCNNTYLPNGELLCGILNNQVGRSIIKRCGNDPETVAKTVKSFPLKVTGNLGFDYAQVTKGGVLLSETDENLQSKKVENLYFAGEILDVDGECGGYNLQWAYSSACAVADAINNKLCYGCK